MRRREIEIGETGEDRQRKIGRERMGIGEEREKRRKAD